VYDEVTMDDDEQVSFADLTENLQEESIESELVESLPPEYERVKSLNKPDNKVLLKDHFLSAIPRLNADKNIPEEEWIDCEESFEKMVRKHPHDLDKKSVVEEKSQIWEFMTGKRASITVEDESGTSHRPTIIDTENIENNRFAVVRLGL